MFIFLPHRYYYFEPYTHFLSIKELWDFPDRSLYIPASLLIWIMLTSKKSKFPSPRNHARAFPAFRGFIVLPRLSGGSIL